MELAALPVKESADGFTPRPFPAGEVNFNSDDIRGFTKFIMKHTIAFPYREDKRIIYVLSNRLIKHMLFLKRDYADESYVSFDFKGNVSVNITKADYENYREELTFDKLCRSLGDLFKEFLLLYKEGKPDMILKRLNALQFFS